MLLTEVTLTALISGHPRETSPFERQVTATRSPAADLDPAETVKCEGPAAPYGRCLAAHRIVLFQAFPPELIVGP